MTDTTIPASRRTAVRPARRRGRALGAATAAVAAVSMLAGGLAVAPAAVAVDRPVPAENPDLGQACGVDVVLMLDWSSSIYTGGFRDDERAAAKALVAAFANTNSRVSVVKFRDQAVANPSLSNGLVTSESIASGGAHKVGLDDDTAVLAYPGSTNWEDAILAAKEQFDTATPARNVPKLAILVTDGAPNAYNDPTDLVNGTATVDEGDPLAVDAGVTAMNALKADGVHALAVGIGVDDTSVDPMVVSRYDALTRISQFTSPQLSKEGGDAYDAATTDIVLTAGDFSNLATDLQKVATDLCAGSLSVTRLVGDSAKPVEYDNPVAGWSVPASVNPTGNWVLPEGASGASATVSTNAGGTSLFQWSGASSKTVTVTDVARTNYATTGASCSVNGAAATPRTITGGAFTVTVGIDDAVACTITSRWTGKVKPQFWISPTRNPVTYGLSTKWRGTVNAPTGTNGALAPVKNATVKIQSRTSSTAAWTTIKTLATDADGYYSWTFTPLRTKQYRAWFPTTTKVLSGGATTTITVRYKVTASINDGTLARGQKVRFTGAIKPNTGVRYVWLQRWTGTAWTNVKKVSLTSTGAYTTTTTSTTKGTKKYRVLHPGGSVIATGASATKTVIWS